MVPPVSRSSGLLGPSRSAPSARLWALLLACGALVGCRPDLPGAGGSEPGGGYRGVLLEEPIPKPDLRLLDTEGRPFDLRADTEGQLTLLFVGFTNCPDVCPVQLAGVAAVFQQKPAVADRARVVFVTADPERDTPERIRDWLDRFDSRFVGLRGTVEEVHALEDALRLPRSTVTRSDERYDVGHSALLIAFSPDGLARVAFPFGTRQADYAHDLPRLLVDRWGAQ